MRRIPWLISIILGGLLIAACQHTVTLPTQTAAGPPETPIQTLPPTSTPAPTQTSPPTETQPPTETMLPSPSPTITPPTFVRENTLIPVGLEPITAENAGDLVELARLGKGRIVDVLLSPDRNYLIVQTTLGVYGYLADRQEEVWRFEDPAGIADMALTRTERWMAVATNDGRIALLIYRRGSMFTRWATGYQQINDLAFSYDGHTLAAIGDQGVSVWPVGETEPRYHYPEMAGEMVRFTPDGEGLIVGAVEETQFYLLGTGEKIRTIFLDHDLGIDYSPDGRYFTNRKKVWDGVTGEFLFEMEWESESDVGYSVFSPDSRLLALSVAYDEKISIWRLSDGERVQQLRSPFNRYSLHTEAIGKLAAPVKRGGGFHPYYLDLAFSPDSGKLAATTYEYFVEIWDLGTGNFERRIPCQGDHLLYRKAYRLTVFGQGSLEQIDPFSGIRYQLDQNFTQLRNTIDFIHDPLNERFALFSPDGEWLFTENIIWRVSVGTRDDRLEQETILGVSPDNDFIFTFDNFTDTVRARAIGDFEVVRKVSLESPMIEELDRSLSGYYIENPAMSPNGKYFSGYIYEYGFVTWDLETGLPVPGLYFGWQTYGGTYSSNGDYLAITGLEGIRIIHVPRREVVVQIEGEYTDIYNNLITFSQDDNYIVLVKDGLQKISIIDNFSSFEIQKIADFYRYEVAISPKNDVISVDNQNQIILLDFETGELLAQLPAHLDEITALGFSPDGRFLATSSEDGTVKLWGIP